MTDSSCSNIYAHSFYRQTIRGKRIITIKLKIANGELPDDICFKCGKTRKEIFPHKYKNTIKLADLQAILPDILGTKITLSQIKEQYKLTCCLPVLSTYLKRYGYTKKTTGKWTQTTTITEQQPNATPQQCNH